MDSVTGSGRAENIENRGPSRRAIIGEFKIVPKLQTCAIPCGCDFSYMYI